MKWTPVKGDRGVQQVAREGAVRLEVGSNASGAFWRAWWTRGDKVVATAPHYVGSLQAARVLAGAALPGLIEEATGKRRDPAGRFARKSALDEARDIAAGLESRGIPVSVGPLERGLCRVVRRLRTARERIESWSRLAASVPTAPLLLAEALAECMRCGLAARRAGVPMRLEIKGMWGTTLPLRVHPDGRIEEVGLSMRDAIVVAMAALVPAALGLSPEAWKCVTMPREDADA